MKYSPALISFLFAISVCLGPVSAFAGVAKRSDTQTFPEDVKIVYLPLKEFEEKTEAQTKALNVGAYLAGKAVSALFSYAGEGVKSLLKGLGKKYQSKSVASVNTMLLEQADYEGVIIFARSVQACEKHTDPAESDCSAKYSPALATCVNGAKKENLTKCFASYHKSVAQCEKDNKKVCEPIAATKGVLPKKPKPLAGLHLMDAKYLKILKAEATTPPDDFYLCYKEDQIADCGPNQNKTVKMAIESGIDRLLSNKKNSVLTFVGAALIMPKIGDTYGIRLLGYKYLATKAKSPKFGSAAAGYFKTKSAMELSINGPLYEADYSENQYKPTVSFKVKWDKKIAHESNEPRWKWINPKAKSGGNYRSGPIAFPSSSNHAFKLTGKLCRKKWFE